MSGNPARGVERRYRALVIDDDRAVLESLTGLLSGEIDVMTCTSTERALRLFDVDHFHVVCCDLTMPGMNGAELLRRVARLPHHVGCVLMANAEEYKRSDEGNPFYVLLRPIDPVRFVRLVLQLARISDMKRSVSALPATRSVPPPAHEPSGSPDSVHLSPRSVPPPSRGPRSR